VCIRRRENDSRRKSEGKSEFVGVELGIWSRIPSRSLSPERCLDSVNLIFKYFSLNNILRLFEVVSGGFLLTFHRFTLPKPYHLPAWGDRGLSNVIWQSPPRGGGGGVH
jgi:hypothetical protein